MSMTAFDYFQVPEAREASDEEKFDRERGFEELIGRSFALRSLLRQVEIVAPTDSTVLIQGETGTGKELVARAIHRLSERREESFVKINCSAIPAGLLESELFGHERGAFTGATSQRLGRFELAHKGTLFLDEVGDLPLELQPKLLRVLQEQEFERLGGARTIRVNVRVVTATNRNLAQMVEEREFRSDLYYRLCIFPLTIPPLRERIEDVPLLVRHFAEKYAQQMSKRIENIPSEVIEAFIGYHWPGNVRELQNVIERAVILSSGTDLKVPVSDLETNGTVLVERVNPATSGDREKILSLLNVREGKRIVAALGETNEVVGGQNGAAARLGMKRSTLQDSMQRLGSACWDFDEQVRVARILRNLIKRAVIQTHGMTLKIPAPELTNNRAPVAPANVDNREERDRIVQILRETKGRVGGPNGAAARLGLKRTTLITRMKKLGIDPRKLL
jgi:formate hydrogenlyase transcriptional activator